MPTVIETEIMDVSIEDDENSQTEAKIITLKLRYEGNENLENEINQGELLNIEIPSHAPPPTP